jgi:catechol 2,3-dioxygenase-like lactoylglutathione lyase family enzyme
MSPIPRPTRRPSPRILAIIALFASSVAAASAQGHCRDGYATPDCPLIQQLATAPIPPIFAPTGWTTVALDHITFRVADYRKEAAFYIALMGWRLRSDDGRQAILDIAPWGSVIFKQTPGQQAAAVDNLCFVIAPWNAATVQAELRKRGLAPVADNDGKGFESFHIKDPDGLDIQIANGKGLVQARQTSPAAKQAAFAPFESTGWKTVWLDHLSYQVPNYKLTASFYTNLLGWKPTYDEGSQQELLIGDVGDMIVRGGNPNDPNFGKASTPPRPARIDHISFGISPWDTDAVKAALESRGLKARVDTSTKDEIHVAAFKSYHTTTPNGYNLQISDLTHDTRLTLVNAVKPKSLSPQEPATHMH